MRRRFGGVGMYGGIGARLMLFAGFAVAIFPLMANAGAAISESDRAEAEAALSIEPVRVVFGVETLAIPRNYLLPDKQVNPNDIVIVNLTWPELKPRTPETRACFEHKIDCETQWFKLTPNWGEPDRFLTTVLKSSDWSRGDEKFGYDVYGIGPSGARIEKYIRQSRTGHGISFDCFRTDGDTNDRDTCSGGFFLTENYGVHIHFRVDQIPKIEEVVDRFRQLIGQFPRL